MLSIAHSLERESRHSRLQRVNATPVRHVLNSIDVGNRATGVGRKLSSRTNGRDRDRGCGANMIGHSLQVLVRDNNVDQALRALKKKMQREGIFREMKQRRAYEKPSERRTREKAEAVRRARKLARKQAQREGLIPAPKRRARGPATGSRPRP
jgi:small subunit ribosomal protein S21